MANATMVDSKNLFEPHLGKSRHSDGVTRLCGGRFRVDGCQHGLFDHVSKTLSQKSWGWWSTSLAVKKALCRTCSHQPHQHVPVEGSRTAKSAVYPKLLCERVAKAILSDPTHFDQIKQSVSVVLV